MRVGRHQTLVVRDHMNDDLPDSCSYNKDSKRQGRTDKRPVPQPVLGVVVASGEMAEVGSAVAALKDLGLVCFVHLPGYRYFVQAEPAVAVPGLSHIAMVGLRHWN